MPVPAPKPWRRPSPEPMPVDLDDEAGALDMIDRIRGLRLNDAESFETWLQQRADAEFAASLLVANAGLTEDTRAELHREVTLLRRQANPPTGGARVWTRSDERISPASEVDDPKLAEARAYDLIDRLRSLRLNGTMVGHDLHRERSYLLTQCEVLLTTATLRPATRTSLSTEVALLQEFSDEVTAPEPESPEFETPAVSEPEPEIPEPEILEPEPDPEIPEPEILEPEPEPEPEPPAAKVGFWRRLSHRLFGPPLNERR